MGYDPMEIDHSDTYKMLPQEASSINQLPKLEILAEIFLLCPEGFRHWFQFDFPAKPSRWEKPLLLFISTPSMVLIIRDRTFQPHLVSVELWRAPSRDLPLFLSLAPTIFDVRRQTKVVSCSCIQDVWFVFMWNASTAQNMFRFEQVSCAPIYSHGTGLKGAKIDFWRTSQRKLRKYGGLALLASCNKLRKLSLSGKLCVTYQLTHT